MVHADTVTDKNSTAMSQVGWNDRARVLGLVYLSEEGAVLMSWRRARRAAATGRSVEVHMPELRQMASGLKGASD